MTRRQFACVLALPVFRSCRRWAYIEPGLHGEVVTVTMSEADILATYFPWWAAQMTRVGKASLISAQACIDDWVVVNWAARA